MIEQPKEFDAEESLALIRSMIESTKASINDSSHYFLLWGWATMIGCIIQYTLLNVVQYQHHYYAWLITPVALVVQIFFMASDQKAEKVKTYISQANKYLWLAIGCSFIVLAVIFTRIGWQYSFPFYVLLYGIGTSISGALLHFKPMVLGGASCFILAAITPYTPYDIQILIAGFAILISYIIPGHLLRWKNRQGHLSIHKQAFSNH